MGETDQHQRAEVIATSSADHVYEASEKKGKLFGVPRKVAFGLIALLAIVAIAVAVGLLLSRGDSNDSSAPRDLSKMEPLAGIVLPGVNMSDLNQASPQYRALEWLAYDDPRNMTIEDDSTELLERFSLVTLYYATGGENWLWKFQWLSVVEHCLWDGILCDWDYQLHGSVYELEFSEPNMQGTLPPEIGNFRNTKRIAFWYTSLEGSIPTEVGLLTSATYLGITHSRIGGTLPTEIGNLNQLSVLILRENSQMVGTIPSEIGNLQQLVDLHLNNNTFSGTIPSEIGNLKQLGRIVLNNNTFSGTIPSEIGNMQYLSFLFLSDNPLLTGTVPMEVGQLESVVWADFQNTSLTGGLDDPAFCRRQDIDYFFLRADCKGSNPKITCECCTTCCNPAGQECVDI
eukprot:scaffold276_cov132-Cylindrotheca_fusiformis.AAC.19